VVIDKLNHPYETSMRISQFYGAGAPESSERWGEGILKPILSMQCHLGLMLKSENVDGAAVSSSSVPASLLWGCSSWPLLVFNFLWYHYGVITSVLMVVAC